MTDRHENQFYGEAAKIVQPHRDRLKALEDHRHAVSSQLNQLFYNSEVGWYFGEFLASLYPDWVETRRLISLELSNRSGHSNSSEFHSIVSQEDSKLPVPTIISVRAAKGRNMEERRSRLGLQAIVQLKSRATHGVFPDFNEVEPVSPLARVNRRREVLDVEGVAILINQRFSDAVSAIIVHSRLNGTLEYTLNNLDVLANNWGDSNLGTDQITNQINKFLGNLYP